MLSTFFRSFLHLIYPPTCTHCKVAMDKHAFLCNDCLAELFLLDPKNRCKQCFSDVINSISLCSTCQKKEPIFREVAAAFDFVGPAASLIKSLKYAERPYLAEGCAAYMSVQFLKLDWPKPDLIVPVPISFTRWITRGYNQSMLLAQSLGALLACPVDELLKRKSGDYSQAGLSQKQRTKLDGSTILLRQQRFFENKTILLVDDVMTTGTTLSRCGEVLQACKPKQIYALSFCRAF